MFAKILTISALVAYAQAGVYDLGHHQATSYSSVNQHVAPVAHYGAPVASYQHAVAPIAQYAAPVAAYHHAPAVVKTVAPVAHYAAAPVAAHYAAPVASHYAAPVAAYHHAPAVFKTVAPVAHYAAPIVKAVHQEVYPDTHPQYSYQYGVQDAHTGDVKNQHEERDGDVVKGYYTLVQPDGVTRTVHYSADSHNGFNAEVEYTGEPIVQKAVVAKAFIPTKTVVAAPVYNAYHH